MIKDFNTVLAEMRDGTFDHAGWRALHKRLYRIEQQRPVLGDAATEARKRAAILSYHQIDQLTSKAREIGERMNRRVAELQQQQQQREGND